MRLVDTLNIGLSVRNKEINSGGKRKLITVGKNKNAFYK